MATMGPSTRRAAEGFAGSVLRLARLQKKVSQREFAALAGVPQSTIAAIESGRRQPSWPVLSRLLAAADLELRVHLAPYDDHDDVLDRRDERFPEVAETARRARDSFLSAAER